MKSNIALNKTSLINKMLPWLMWAVAASFFFSHYFIRVLPQVISDHILRDFAVTAVALSIMQNCFYASYTIFQVPAGILVDRFGTRWLIAGLMILAGLSSFMFAQTDSIQVAYLARFIFGGCAAFAFVGAIKTATYWFPPQVLALIISMTQTMGMVGGIVALKATPILVDSFGWRDALVIMGIIIICFGVLVALIVRNHRNGKETKQTEQTQQTKQEETAEVEKSFLAVAKSIIICRYTWAASLFAGFVFAPMMIFGESLGSPFLVATYNISASAAKTVLSSVFLGWCLGGISAGWLSNIIGRVPVMKISSSSGIILFSSILFFTNMPYEMLLLIAFLFGLTNAGLVAGYTSAGELHSKEHAGFSISIANMVSVLIGQPFLYLVGWFLDLNWDGTLLNGIPVYSTTDYKIAFLILPICSFVALIASFFAKETMPPKNSSK